VFLCVIITTPSQLFCLLDFANRDTNLIINSNAGTSAVRLGSVSGITGWTQDSIVLSYGNNAPSSWTEAYSAGTLIGTGGTAAPTNLVYNNSNAINALARFVRTTSNAMVYLIRVNSNTINRYATLVKQNSSAINSLAGFVRTTSNAMTYLIRVNSNAINGIYPLVKQSSNTINRYSTLVKQNSAAINAMGPIVRTTSNSVNAIAPIVRTNSNLLNVLTPLIRQNSNAINSFGTTSSLATLVRTTSNALLFGIKNNSNALSYGIKNNSNAIISLARLVRTTSNAVNAGGTSQLSIQNSNAIILKCQQIMQNSNAIITLKSQVRTNSNALAYSTRTNSSAIINLSNLIRVNSNAFAAGSVPSALAKQNSSAIVTLERIAHIFTNHSNFLASTNICALNYYKAGLSVTAGKTLTFNDPLPISGKINLNNTGVLSFGSDVYFGADVYFTNGGLLKGNGHTLMLTGSLTIPVNKTVRIDTNTIIDAQGNNIILDTGSKFVVSTGVTFTLKNVNLKNLSGIQIDLEGAGTAALALANSTICLDQNFNFADGKLFIHEDVNLCGTNKFIYESMYPMYIASSSALICNPASIFRYIPGGGTSHTDRTLMRFADTTSFFYLDNATLEAPVNGLQILRGTMAFDNKCSIKNLLADGVTPNISRTEAVTFGDNTANNDATLYVFSGARVEVSGYLDYNNAS
ncbi:hypothetical protein K2X40_03080, partial [Candidatus Babeliales bacterium]|nr:hypothetical protein [Candidatus Babeliales bacterium]